MARVRAANNNTAAAKIHCATLNRLRRPGAKYLSVYLCVAARRGLRRKGRECVEAPCPAQLTSAAIAGEQIVECTGEGGSVTGLDEQSGLLVLDHVAKPTGIERDHRCLAEERFHGDEAEAFVNRWNDDRGGALIERSKVRLRDLSMPADTRSDTELLRELLQGLTIWSVAHDVE